jgi:hypothetical protein
MSEIRWNPVRQLWETEQADLFSALLEPFSETFPTSGMTQSGRLFPLPQSAHPIAGNGFSSLELLHTPDTMPDAPNKGSNTKSKPAGLGNQVIEIALLPTPQSMDWVAPKNAENRERQSERGYGIDLREAVVDIPLLPSPVAHQSGSTPEEHLARKPGRTQVTDLAIIVENGLMQD